MSTITRTQFTQRFEGKSINLQTADLTSAQRTALQRADANNDGKLEGAAEINNGFTRLDDFDRNGSRNSVNAGTTARPTAVGTAVNNLAAASTAAPRRGLSGSTGVTTGSSTNVANGTAHIDSTSKTGQRAQMATGRVTVNGNTYDFRSGGFGKGNLPKGTYEITTHMNSRNDPSMSVGGVGYSFAMSNKYDSRVGATRTLLRIHPDGGTAGTLGCMGIVGNADVQRQFRADMQAEIARNGGSYNLTLN